MKTAAFRPEESPKISLVKTNRILKLSRWVIPIGVSIWFVVSGYYLWLDFQPVMFQRFGNLGLAIALITFAVHRYFRQCHIDEVDDLSQPSIVIT